MVRAVGTGAAYPAASGGSWVTGGTGGTAGVDEAQVSRDERDEEAGVTTERARRVVDALGDRMVTRVVESTDER